MRAHARFSDPSEVTVTMVLTANLHEFEVLRDSLLESSVPYHQVRSLISQIGDASMKLRRTVEGEPNAARYMVEGDI